MSKGGGDLSHNPHSPLPDDGKWSFTKYSSIIDGGTTLDQSTMHKAQLNVVVMARQAGLSNAISKELLGALGIAERINTNEGETES